MPVVLTKEYYIINNVIKFTVLTDSGGEFNYKNEDNVIFKKSKNKYGAVLSESWILKIREKNYI